MKATEVNFNKFLSQSDTQFVIPVYQRNYDWTKAQCKQLVDDILMAGCEKDISAHFIGSIVYIHDDVYTSSSINELNIIDGQQRLTTITLIYLAVVKVARRMGDEQRISRINETYLINKFADEDSKLKLRPTENNHVALKYLLSDEDTGGFAEHSRLVENFDYLQSRIFEENIETILDGLAKLMFVEISLDRVKDDPQRIFESLNSTGLELTQADLIRNYILMGLEREDQIKIYEKYWEKIELLAKEEITNANWVSDFIRDYLTMINKKIPNKSQVYIAFKENFPDKSRKELSTALAEIKRYAIYYNKLINPFKESDSDIRTQLRYINKLEINVCYPFLLQVYNDYGESKITKETFVDVLELVQTFCWRRFIVGLPTNALNKIFMRLYEDIDDTNYLGSIEKSLVKKKGAMRFPNDDEVVSVLKDKDVYGIKSKNRGYFLERLENHNNREPVQIEGNADITIEHVFPQNPHAKWKKELPEDEYNQLKNVYLNTVANLTLSGNNGALGNRPFIEKRDMNVDGKEQGYRYSRLWLNKYLASLEAWTTKELLGRFGEIEARFKQIWKFPYDAVDSAEQSAEINIFDAEDPRNKKLEYAIFFDQKLNVRKVSKLYLEIMQTLFDLQSDTFLQLTWENEFLLQKTQPCSDKQCR